MKFISPLFAVVASACFANAFAQTNESCANPDPYCIGLTYTANAGGTDANVLDPGNDYGCLFSQPNPSWFFFQTETVGMVEMNLYAPNDIDFIIYGPFDDMNEMLSMCGQLGVNPEAPEVDCSYSGTNNEYPMISTTQVGEYYLMLITNYASIVQDITLQQIGGTGSLDCSVFDQTFHEMEGTAFYDSNQNGIKETGESTLPNVQVNFAPMNTNVVSNANGDFEYIYFTEDTIDYVVSASMEGWANTTPDEILFTLDTTTTDTTGLLFGFFPDSLFYANDLDVVNINAGCAGTNLSSLVITNTGTLNSSGLIAFTMDDDFSFIDSSYPTDSIVGNTLYFSFASLAIFNQFNVQIWLEPSTSLMGGDTIVNWAQIQTLDSLGNVITTITDSIPSVVTCSYDPNNKIVLPNGHLAADPIIEPTDKLEYIINFQNTGNAPAVNVKIKDQLSQLIDATTFEFLSSSHEVFVSLDSNGMVIFDFPNINLPDSISNELLSKGYVKYRVALDPGVMPNDMVENTAAIYFDNNSPVITNTTLNVLSCFIQPDPIVLSYAGGVITTDVTDFSLNFYWTLDGVPLTTGSLDYINCTDEGTYTLVVSNQFGCQTMASYTYSTAGMNTPQVIDASVYPNPSSGDFQVRFAEAGQYQLTVMDESGRLILSESISSSGLYTLKGDQLTQGVYFVQISDAEGASGFYRIVKL